MHLEGKAKTAWLWTRYILINGIFGAAVYFGLITGHDNAANVALFMGWIASIMGCLIILGLWLEKQNNSTELSDMLARQDPSIVPYPIDLTFDALVTLAFAWSGHYILAGFYIVQMMACKELRDIPKNVMLRTLRKTHES